MLSIIVPVYNEEAALPAFLQMIDSWSHPCEIVFSDGGSTDATRTLLEGRTVITGTKGRGAQCRRGASATHGNHILFLHADTSLDGSALGHIEEALDSGVKWGCLTVDFTEHNLEYRFAIQKSNWRAKYGGVPFGDQAMFMTRQALEEAGGMPALPIMEDYELSLRLRKRFGWPKQLPDTITASVRRFESGNRALIGLQMVGLRLLYRMGVSPERISSMYGDIRGRK